MTMSELAKLANVSVSTVSKAFCNADDVSAATKKHIFDLAKKYGCYGKFYKGKYTKKVIAVICPELTSEFYVTFIEKFQKLIDNNNCIAIISADHFNASRQEELLEYFISYLKVDGILIFHLRSQLKKAYDTPIVTLFSTVDTSVDSINTNYKSAIFDAIQILTEYGHKNIAFLGELLTKTKALCFQTAALQTGLSCSYVIESRYRFEKAGIDGIRQLLEKEVECTAIICAYDNIALGAIRELRRQGLSVPEDFSVIGIDNIPVARYMETTLSTIGVDFNEVCEIAWELLKKKINNKFFHTYQQIIINGKLILRESVARLQ